MHELLLSVHLSISGVLGSPKTCLHAVLSLVRLTLNPYSPGGCQLSHPRVAELCYKLLYAMCANHELSQATLRYLRNNHDYFYAQLTALPFPTMQRVDGEEEERDLSDVALLNQQAWILQTVALELRMTALNSQHSHVQRLTRLLLNSTSPVLGQAPPDISMMTNQSLEWSMPDSAYHQFSDGRQKLLVILDLVSFVEIPLPPLQLVFFDQERVEQVITSCEVKSEDDGVPYVDVKVLHRLLMNDVNSLQGAAAIGQKPNIVKVHAPAFCVHSVHNSLSLLSPGGA